MSIDFHPFSNIFVTAGGDSDFSATYDEDSKDTFNQGFIKVW